MHVLKKKSKKIRKFDKNVFDFWIKNSQMNGCFTLLYILWMLPFLVFFGLAMRILFVLVDVFPIIKFDVRSNFWLVFCFEWIGGYICMVLFWYFKKKS